LGRGAPRFRKKPADKDPLRQFCAAVPRRARTVDRIKPFASGEHVWLGNGGVVEACQQLRAAGIAVSESAFGNIQRLHGEESFSYGELVALSGDFYGSPSELFEEQPSPVAWLWEQNDTSDLRNLFAKELRWIEDRQRGRGLLAYPEQSVRMAWNAKSYVELALKNVDHFGWHNMVAYCRFHTAALQLAAGERGSENETWRRALVYNAFADHFLTDGFAAGHVRVPRAEIRAWAESAGLSDKTAAALSKVLHDQDGHVDGIHAVDENQSDGLAVENAKADRWRTFCDGQLFLFPGSSKEPAVRNAVSAVASSVVELVAAWKEGVVPDQTFGATAFVPFPDPAGKGIAEKFARVDLDAIFKSAAWYQKVPWIGPDLKVQHLRDLVAALPELMERFRNNVVADVARDPAIARRLSPPYVAAFRSIR